MDKRKYLNGNELGRLFAAIDGQPGKTPAQRRRRKRDALFFRLMFVLGLRKSEAINIRLSDIDEEAKQIRIPRMKRKDKNRIRIYDMDEDILRLYREYRKLRDAARGTSFNEYLFLTTQRRADGHIGKDQVYGNFKRYAQAAGLPAYFSPHCLRHACAIALAKRGASSVVIQRRLGHSSRESAEAYLEFVGTEAQQMEALTNKMLEI